MALTATIQEGLWLSQIKAELDVQSDSKEIQIRADNQSGTKDQAFILRISMRTMLTLDNNLCQMYLFSE